MRLDLLERLAGGQPLGEALADLGIPQQRVHGWAAYDPAWQDQLDTALTAGRDPELDHGRTATYRIHKCRCPECRTAKAAEA
ncbi:hypothetical protein [Streptomyces sp. CAU 1734]|uniref:hypothetical protein n=1 Tax=Streptomyces sp. CAU 1734 TaxID=3140360 RepID=UPI0032615925